MGGAPVSGKRPGTRCHRRWRHRWTCSREDAGDGTCPAEGPSLGTVRVRTTGQQNAPVALLRRGKLVEARRAWVDTYTAIIHTVLYVSRGSPTQRRFGEHRPWVAQAAICL